MSSSSPADVPDNPRARHSLDAALHLLGPLVRWLLRSGVNYGSLAQGLKQVFLEQARAELQERGAKVTDSALSVLSGVHRKDVRALVSQQLSRPRLEPTPATMVFTRWISDPKLREIDADGLVQLRRSLPRLGPMPSFEALAREVSSDVHPRTLLDDMLRLGLVAVEDEHVLLRSERFVVSDGEREAAETLGINVADHLSAAVHNLHVTDPARRLLEQSVFASGLSASSVEALGEFARRQWSQSFDAMVQAATTRLAQDDARGGPRGASWRMRFGVYYYGEPESGAGADSEGAPSATQSPAPPPQEDDAR